MTEASLGPFQAGQFTFDLTVDGNGIFTARNDQLGDFSSSELAKLKETAKVRASQARTRVSVPFTRLRGNGFAGPWEGRRGVATGIHNGNGSVLVRWTDGTSEQLAAHGRQHICGKLSAAEEREWVDLQTAADDADRALRAFTSQHFIVLKDEVRKAIEAAQESRHG
jgi:hypothetical protein